MAEKDDIILKIKEKIAQLDQDSAKAYREQLKALKDNNSALETYKNLLEDVDTRIEDQYRGFAGLLIEIKKINEELGKENKHIKDATRAFRGLESIASKLRDDQKGYTDLNKEQLKQEKSKLKSLTEQAQAAAKQIAIDKGIVDLAHVDLAFRHDLSEEERALLTAAQENFSIYERTNKLLEDRIKEENKLNKTLGSTGLLLAGMSKIPIVGPLLKTNEALDAAREKAKAGGNSFQAMGAAMGSMGKSLASGLTDPLFLIGLLVKGFQMFMDIGFKTDKQIVSLSKSMGVSQEAAKATREHMVGIQNNTEEIFNRTENQINAQLELADAFGATRGFTDQQIQGQIDLTKKMGLTAEEAAGINKLAMANGITAKNVTDTVVKQTQALAKQTGIQLNNKEVVQDVAKVSGQLRLQYKNNPTLIAKAVVETKKLGINMEIAANAAKGLLDFESSIENELSAELLTGKALNLERARGLALNGDSVGAAKEMLAQVGSAADFQNMNVIQQEAIAKAVGMSTDDLANSLVTQENLKKLGDETRNQIEEKIKAAKALGTEEGDSLARRLEASAFSDEEAIKALESVDQQAKFNELIEKMKSMLASIVEGPAKQFLDYMLGTTDGVSNMAAPLKSVFDTLAGIVNFVKEWGSTLATIAKLYVVIKAAQVGYNIVLGITALLNKKSIADTKKEGLIEATKTAFKVGGTMGPAAIAAIPIMIAAGIAAFAMFNKGGSVPGTNTKSDSVPALLTSGEYVIPNSNGKTGTEKYNEMISSKTPSTFNKGGEMPAKSNTEKYNEVIIPSKSNKGDLTQYSNSGGRGNSNQDSAALIAAINGLKNDMKVLASRPINTSVQLDGKELVLAQGTYSKEKGDANRMESWQMS